MGLVQIKVKSKAPAQLLYEIAHHPFKFVDVMPNIKEVRMIEVSKDAKYSKTEWVLDLPLPKILGEVSWIKDARWDDDKLTCELRLNRDSKGIVKKIMGLWTFTPCREGAEMCMKMDLTVRHFLIGANTTTMIDTLFGKNMESLMSAIGAEAEKNAAGGRAGAKKTAAG